MSIKRINNKNGVSFLITVSSGRDSNGKQIRHYKTFTPPQTWSEKRMTKEAQKFEIEFTKEIELGFELNNKQTFESYSKYVLDLKERTGAKHRTLIRYKELLKRINSEIGYIKISDLKVHHLNNLYKKLLDTNVTSKDKAIARINLLNLIKSKNLTQTQLAKLSGVSSTTLKQAINGLKINFETAKLISNSLKLRIEDIFKIEKSDRKLSAKTVIEHHRLISAILSQAEKEMLVPFNVAKKATPPKIKKHEVNYFQPEEVQKILKYLIQEPIQWQLITHLLLITGCRRGEIAGLKWNKIDFENNEIKIDTSLLYSKERGIYEDTTKTNQERIVSVPKETINMIKEYRKEVLELQIKSGSYWNKTDYVFVRDNGLPIHPDSITSWLNKFSKKYNLVHINPHAFRHTHVSVLYANGVDLNTISKRVGHAKVSTTSDIYSHLIKEHDKQASECIADIVLRNNVV